MATQVGICNEALLRFGSVTILSIDDETREARACKTLWDGARDALIESHPWGFAMKRAALGSPLVDAPAFGFEYAYSLPADCLRVWESEDELTDWAVEDGTFLADIEAPKIRYIAKITDVSKYPPSFCRCLAAALAADLSSKLLEDRGRQRAALLDELETILLPRARMLNTIERPKVSRTMGAADMQAHTWITEGR